MAKSGADANICEIARAKINLYLHVLGKRDDGFHELESLVAFADVGDKIEVSTAPELSLEITGPFASATPTGDGNLVLKAARGLRDLLSAPQGAKITLTKNLPVAAGIGGGSADAAATLRALKKLWAASLSDQAMLEFALSLGSDVPVCIQNLDSMMTGRGETLAPVPALPRMPLVLINPGVQLETAHVFAGLTRSFSVPVPVTNLPGNSTDFAAMLSNLKNDLEAPAIDLAPPVGDVINALGAEGGCLLARMSGSGATCFGLFADSGTASNAASILARANSDWWVCDTFIGGE
jgi:4-diphosphocytidyl-2-C-methyl-D-erythritol kinase